MQWRLAARDLGLPVIDEDRSSTAASEDARRLRAHLFGAPLADNTSGAFYRSYGGLCAAARNGTAIIYLRVYKSGNEALCSALRAIDDGSYPDRLQFLQLSHGVDRDPSNSRGTSGVAADRVHAALSALRAEGARHRAIVFTCVREPLSHFAAGFGELQLFKVTKDVSRDAASDARPRAAPTALEGGGGGADAKPQLRDFQTTRAYAEKFVRRVVAGGLDLSRVLNAHVLPQVAFLARPGAARDAASASLPGRACCGGGEVDLVGSLDDLGGTWSELGRRVLAAAALGASSRTAQRSLLRSWPAMRARPSAHPVTNATAGFLPRVRMEELLRDSPTHAVAMCRVLLVDFVCFRYRLPPTCQRAIGERHGVACTLRGLPPRMVAQ